MDKKICLIVGISGQDGSLLSEFLLKKKIKVVGTTTTNNVSNLKKIDIKKKITIIYSKKYDKSFFKRLIKKFKINQIYYFSGQSSVAKSELLALETIESNTIPLINILEVLREEKKNIRLINAVSSEMYGSGKQKIDEKTVVNPNSFYGLAKSISYEIARTYRDQFNLNLSNLILFNHESKLRPDYFVLKKIISGVKNLKEKKKKKKIIVGNLNIKRDWGWAPEYVQLMNKIANSKYKEDFVIGTGKTYKLKYLVKEIFTLNKLPIKNNIKTSKKFFRNNEIKENYASIKKIKKIFNWKPKFTIKRMIYELNK